MVRRWSNERGSTVALSLSLIFPRSQSVLDHVVQAKYVTEVNWPTATGKRSTGTKQVPLYISFFFSVSFLVLYVNNGVTSDFLAELFTFSVLEGISS